MSSGTNRPPDSKLGAGHPPSTPRTNTSSRAFQPPSNQMNTSLSSHNPRAIPPTPLPPSSTNLSSTATQSSSQYPTTPIQNNARPSGLALQNMSLLSINSLSPSAPDPLNSTRRQGAVYYPCFPSSVDQTRPGSSSSYISSPSLRQTTIVPSSSRVPPPSFTGPHGSLYNHNGTTHVPITPGGMRHNISSLSLLSPSATSSMLSPSVRPRGMMSPSGSSSFTRPSSATAYNNQHHSTNNSLSTPRPPTSPSSSRAVPRNTPRIPSTMTQHNQAFRFSPNTTPNTLNTSLSRPGSSCSSATPSINAPVPLNPSSRVAAPHLPSYSINSTLPSTPRKRKEDARADRSGWSDLVLAMSKMSQYIDSQLPLIQDKVSDLKEYKNELEQNHNTLMSGLANSSTAPSVLVVDNHIKEALKYYDILHTLNSIVDSFGIESNKHSVLKQMQHLSHISSVPASELYAHNIINTSTGTINNDGNTPHTPPKQNSTTSRTTTSTAATPSATATATMTTAQNGMLSPRSAMQQQNMMLLGEMDQATPTYHQHNQQQQQPQRDNNSNVVDHNNTSHILCISCKEHQKGPSNDSKNKGPVSSSSNQRVRRVLGFDDEPDVRFITDDDIHVDVDTANYWHAVYENAKEFAYLDKNEQYKRMAIESEKSKAIEEAKFEAEEYVKKHELAEIKRKAKEAALIQARNKARSDAEHEFNLKQGTLSTTICDDDNTINKHIERNPSNTINKHTERNPSRPPYSSSPDNNTHPESQQQLDNIVSGDIDNVNISGYTPIPLDITVISNDSIEFETIILTDPSIAAQAQVTSAAHHHQDDTVQQQQQQHALYAHIPHNVASILYQDSGEVYPEIIYNYDGITTTSTENVNVSSNRDQQHQQQNIISLPISYDDCYDITTILDEPIDITTYPSSHHIPHHHKQQQQHQHHHHQPQQHMAAQRYDVQGVEHVNMDSSSVSFEIIDTHNNFSSAESLSRRLNFDNLNDDDDNDNNYDHDQSVDYYNHDNIKVLHDNKSHSSPVVPNGPRRGIPGLYSSPQQRRPLNRLPQQDGILNLEDGDLDLDGIWVALRRSRRQRQQQQQQQVSDNKIDTSDSKPLSVIGMTPSNTFEQALPHSLVHLEPFIKNQVYLDKLHCYKAAQQAFIQLLPPLTDGYLHVQQQSNPTSTSILSGQCKGGRSGQCTLGLHPTARFISVLFSTQHFILDIRKIVSVHHNGRITYSSAPLPQPVSSSSLHNASNNDMISSSSIYPSDTTSSSTSTSAFKANIDPDTRRRLSFFSMPSFRSTSESNNNHEYDSTPSSSRKDNSIPSLLKDTQDILNKFTTRLDFTYLQTLNSTITTSHNKKQHNKQSSSSLKSKNGQHISQTAAPQPSFLTFSLVFSSPDLCQLWAQVLMYLITPPQIPKGARITLKTNKPAIKKVDQKQPPTVSSARVNPHPAPRTPLTPSQSRPGIPARNSSVYTPPRAQPTTQRSASSAQQQPSTPRSRINTSSHSPVKAGSSRPTRPGPLTMPPPSSTLDDDDHNIPSTPTHSRHQQPSINRLAEAGSTPHIAQSLSSTSSSSSSSAPNTVSKREQKDTPYPASNKTQSRLELTHNQQQQSSSSLVFYPQTPPQTASSIEYDSVPFSPIIGLNTSLLHSESSTSQYQPTSTTSRFADMYPGSAAMAAATASASATPQPTVTSTRIAPNSSASNPGSATTTPSSTPYNHHTSNNIVLNSILYDDNYRQYDYSNDNNYLNSKLSSSYNPNGLISGSTTPRTTPRRDASSRYA